MHTFPDKGCTCDKVEQYSFAVQLALSKKSRNRKVPGNTHFECRFRRLLSVP